MKIDAKLSKKINENICLSNLMLQTHDYIRKSDQLRCEINLEKDITIILDKALLCISYMTGDMVFYRENIKKLLKFSIITK